MDCIKCGKPIEQWLLARFHHRRVKICARCAVDAFTTLFSEVSPPETPEEIDAELRSAGLDPEKIGHECAELAERLLAQYEPKEK